MNPWRDELARQTGRVLHLALSTPPSWLILAAVVSFAVSVWAYWRIFQRAGFPGCWSLFLFVPCVNVIALCGLAFSRWPVQGKKR